MSRLLSIVGAVLLAGGVAQGAVVFEPEPAPRACDRHYSRLNARYEAQLRVLNNYPYKTLVPVRAEAYGNYVRPVVDLMQQPCERPTNLYWRKGDLLRAAEAADEVGRPVVGGVSAGERKAKGMILIFPKGMMNRPVREFEKGETARQLTRAE